MKLLRCYIGRYGVLRQLHVDFSTSIIDDSLALDFLVGPNGCGKSTLLQALAEIFDKLEVSVEMVDFPFMIEYEVRRDNVTKVYQVANCDFDGDPLPDGEVGLPRIYERIDKDTWEQIENWSDELLPQTVAILTTGIETGWQQILGRARSSVGERDTLAEIGDEAALVERALRELPGPPPADDEDEERELTPGRATLIPTEALSLVTLSTS